MLIGNGYLPGHAQFALELIRSEPALRGLFAHRRADLYRCSRRRPRATMTGMSLGPLPRAAVYCAADPHATAMLVDDGRIAWLGAAPTRRPPTAVVDLDGALVTPAFVDAHVHATDTGLALRGLDLSGARSAAEVLDAVAAFAATAGRPTRSCSGTAGTSRPGPTSTPPTAAELDRAGGGRRVYLSQASVHSALCSSAAAGRRAARDRGRAGVRRVGLGAASRPTTRCGRSRWAR